MSHIQGTDYVGSMVVMEDGLPKKGDYRRFKVRDVPGNDDFAAMREVLTRRLQAYLIERSQPAAEREGRFSYPPQLLVVDGGKGQLGVAREVVEELGLDDEIPVAALAKRFEEVFVPGLDEAVRIPRQSEALYLLQRLRDEAHRFAVGYHRLLRDKRMTTSVLDGIPGLGPVRQKRLRAELGGVAGVKRASLDELQALPWLPDRWPRPCGTRSTPRAAEPGGPDHRAGGDLWEASAGWCGRRASPKEPTPSTSSRSCRWRRAPGRRHRGGRRRHRERARWPVWRRPVVPTGWWASTPPTPSSTWPAHRGGGPATSGPGRGRSRWPAGTFDAAVACLVFEHIVDVDAALAEVAGCCGRADASCSS